MEPQDFGDLFGSEDEASDIDDGQSASSQGSAESGVSEQQIQPQSRSQPQPATDDEGSVTGQTQDGDIDDLFGSEEEEEVPPPRHPQKRPVQRTISDDENSDDDENNEDRMQLDADEEMVDEQAQKKQRVEEKLHMPELPLPMSEDGKYHLGKMPRFLDVEMMQPFDPTTLNLETDQSMTTEQQALLLQKIDSTIRWRRQDVDGQHILESNTHIVEWEDGNMSLMVGNECFDIHSKQIPSSAPMMLLAHQTDSLVLESHIDLTDQMLFRPSNLQSDAHRYLAAHIASQHVKKVKTKGIVTTSDPEKAKQELEKQESERMRAQRKLEGQRRRAEAKYEGLGSRRSRRDGAYDEYDSPLQQRPSRLDTYEDDFVVEDEEYDDEDEAPQDRLRQIIRGGMDHYQSRTKEVDEDEEDVEEEDDDEEEEEEEEETVVVRRPRHRHMESDDEE